jgi:pilus assembly protein CpaE
LAPDVKGTLLWVSRNVAAVRDEIEAAGREFQLAVGYCDRADLVDRVQHAGCTVIGIELADDPQPTLAFIRDVCGHLPGTTILAASSDRGIPTMRAALEAGAVDLLSLPLDRREFHKALIRCMQAARANAAMQTHGEVITICGARGGVGVTTLAVNLAVRMVAITGGEVALVDLDLQRGDVATYLNLAPSESLAAIAKSRDRVDQLFLHTAMTRHASGVAVLPAPAEIEESDLVTHDDVALCLRLLRERFRYTIVDTARVLTLTALAAFEHADRVLLLTDLSVPGVRAARRTTELLGRLQPSPRVELVITGVFRGALTVRDAARAIGQEPVHTIPRDEASASEAMNAGAPVNGRQSALALAIGQLAAKLAGVTPEHAEPRTSSQLLRRILRREVRA